MSYEVLKKYFLKPWFLNQALLINFGLAFNEQSKSK